MPYTLLKEKGVSPENLAAAKKLVLDKATTPTKNLDQPHIIMGLQKRAKAEEVFWFTTSPDAKSGQEGAVDALVNFYAYLLSRHIKLEALRDFDVTASVLSPEEAEKSKDLIAQLSELSDDEKYANFVEFIGKRDLTPKYKSRGRKK